MCGFLIRFFSKFYECEKKKKKEKRPRRVRAFITGRSYLVILHCVCPCVLRVEVGGLKVSMAAEDVSRCAFGI